ncbi:hypothetical protein Hamer_G022605, partial [Homarus americanus]
EGLIIFEFGECGTPEIVCHGGWSLCLLLSREIIVNKDRHPRLPSPDFLRIIVVIKESCEAGIPELVREGTRGIWRTFICDLVALRMVTMRPICVWWCDLSLSQEGKDQKVIKQDSSMIKVWKSVSRLTERHNPA